MLELMIRRFKFCFTQKIVVFFLFMQWWVLQNGCFRLEMLRILFELQSFRNQMYKLIKSKTFFRWTFCSCFCFTLYFYFYCQLLYLQKRQVYTVLLNKHYFINVLLLKECHCTSTRCICQGTPGEPVRIFSLYL